MRRIGLLGVAPIAGITLMIILMMRGVAVAQHVTESALKAAFIYNFARFTTWPDEWPTSDPFVICVLDDAMRDALQRVVKDREFAAHRITVVPAAAGNRACHVLYLSGIPTSQAAPLIAGLREAPVLTISDIEGFAEVGGMAQFFFESGQLHFTIRLNPVKRARLRISSRLLALARQHE